MPTRALAAIAPATANGMVLARFDRRVSSWMASTSRETSAWKPGSRSVIASRRTIGVNDSGISSTLGSCALDECRNDRHAAGERRLDFEADEVVRICQSLRSVRLRDLRPSGADQLDEDVALPDGVVDPIGEVNARRDAVDVDEDLDAVAEPVSERIGKPSRVTRSVVAPIADEDSRRRLPAETAGSLSVLSSHRRPPVPTRWR